MIKTIFTIILFLMGCSQQENFQIITSQPPSLATITTETTVQNPPIVVESAVDWQAITNGIEVRTTTPPNSLLAQMTTVRLDPSQVIFRVHYTPDEPRHTAQWREALPDALVIINANFFHPDYDILGMLIADGVVYGQSFTERGGTFFVNGDAVGIRSNIYEPYQGEAYTQAIQAFPMLVYNSSQAYTNQRDTRPSRRTLIGMDAQGRVIIMATPGIGLGLFDLSAWLPTTDLGLMSAFNLDGGGSTMMMLPSVNYAINSFDAVPSVLAVYSR